MRRPIARDQNQRKRAVSTQVSSWLNFNPETIGNLVLWLDASDTNTITESSGDVSQWNDKSSQGNHFTQATALSQPKTGIDTANGKNLIRFDGSNDFLQRESNITTTAYTLFLVYSNTNVGASAAGRTILGSLTNSPSWFLQRGGDAGPLQDLTIGFDGSLLFNTSVKRQVTTSKTSSTGARILRSDKKDFNPVSQNTGTLVIGYVGRRFDGNYLACDVCEVIVYNLALTRNQISTVESYLSVKWGTP